MLALKDYKVVFAVSSQCQVQLGLVSICAELAGVGKIKLSVLDLFIGWSDRTSFEC